MHKQSTSQLLNCLYDEVLHPRLDQWFTNFFSIDNPDFFVIGYVATMRDTEVAVFISKRLLKTLDGEDANALAVYCGKQQPPHLIMGMLILVAVHHTLHQVYLC